MTNERLRGVLVTGVPGVGFNSIYNYLPKTLTMYKNNFGRNDTLQAMKQEQQFGHKLIYFSHIWGFNQEVHKAKVIVNKVNEHIKLLNPDAVYLLKCDINALGKRIMDYREAVRNNVWHSYNKELELSFSYEDVVAGINNMQTILTMAYHDKVLDISNLAIEQAATLIKSEVYWTYLDLGKLDVASRLQ